MEALALHEEVSTAEIIKLAAVDNEFYGRHFFPKTLRQSTPKMHHAIDGLLFGGHRYVAIKVFRDGAKTSKLRLFTSKRIAYGISHTILFVSEAQDHAIKSLDWLRRNVRFNKKWADTYKLRPGEKWAGPEIEIWHGMDEYPIRIIALGITGQTRGVNIDDFRPDLIVVDDPCDEENTGTPEQRKKISNLFYGALKESLAPASECPDAMMVLLQTPLHGEDLIEQAMKDPQWATAAFSCFTPEGDSAWPERYPLEVLKAEKQAAIDRNQLSIWMREKEVTIVADELSTFKAAWLQYWDVLPEGMATYIGVDPTPPPKENDVSINPKLDDATIVAIGIHKGDVYVLDTYGTKSPNPDDLISKIFEFVVRFRPLRVGFESILFARTTKFYLEKEMRRRQHFFSVLAVEDKRKKQVRITQAISGRASQRALFVHRSQVELISQYTAYPNVSHDDYLDALAIALDQINPIMEDDALDGEYRRIEEEERNIPELEEWRSVL